MTEQTFDQRVQDWLASGPAGLPTGALEAALDATQGVRQDRPRPRIAGRPIARRTLLLAAAVGLIVAAAGIGVVGGLFADGTSEQSTILVDFPEAATVLERAGGPSTAAETVVLGTLPARPHLVVGASCTGSAPLVVKAHDRSLQVNPDEVPAGADPQLARTITVPCDGSVAVTGLDQPAGPPTAGPLELSLDVPAGVAWRIAVGELTSVPDQPAFPDVQPSEDAFFIQPMSREPWLIIAGRFGIGVQVPEDAGRFEVLVQCAGDPIQVTALDYLRDPAGAPTGETTSIDCSDPGKTTAVPFETQERSMDVAAISRGVTWVRLRPQAFGTGVSDLPEAPELPAGIAEVPFVESDGNYVAIGTLGGNRQTLVQVTGSAVGPIGGGVFGVRRDGQAGGQRLELWSVEEGGPIVEITSTDATASVYPGPTDGTHGWHYYAIIRLGFAFEWHRVALDGTNDTIVTTVEPGWTVPPNGRLAIDDSVFVVDRCHPTGCTRVISDGATATVREVPLEGDPTCELVGIVDGLAIARSGPSCDNATTRPLTSQPLDGGPRQLVTELAGSTILVRTSSGPRAVILESKETQSTVYSVDLAGGTPREVLAFEETSSTRSPQDLRLPAGDWVLVGVALGDIPTAQIGRNAPFLLNIATGESIELVNLPHDQ